MGTNDPVKFKSEANEMGLSKEETKIYKEVREAGVTGVRGVMLPQIAAAYAKRLNVMRKWKKPDQKDVDTLEIRKNAFYDFCEKTGTTITNESMFLALGTTRNRVMSVLSGTDTSEEAVQLREFWKRTIAECSAFRAWALMDGHTNPKAGIFMHKVHDGYIDESNILLKTGSMITDTISTDEITEKYKHLIEVYSKEPAEFKVETIGNKKKKT
jgi:hypothetical protein